MTHEPSVPTTMDQPGPYQLGRAVRQGALTVTSLGRWTDPDGASHACLIERLRPEYARNLALGERFVQLGEQARVAGPERLRPLRATHTLKTPGGRDTLLVLDAPGALTLTALIEAVEQPQGPSDTGGALRLSYPLALLIADSVIAGLQSISKALGHFHGLLDPDLLVFDTSGQLLIDGLVSAVCTRQFQEDLHDHPTVWSHQGQHWIAPEVRFNRPQSHACDVYFIGALLYRLITGQTHAEEWQPEWSFIMARLDAAGVEGQHLGPLVKLLHRCLAERPSHRVHRLDDLRESFDALGLYGAQTRLQSDLQLLLHRVHSRARRRWGDDHTDLVNQATSSHHSARLSDGAAAPLQHTHVSNPSHPSHPGRRTTAAPPIEDILGRSRYRILDELGVGGMGTVYRVFDTELREELALKVLRRDLTDQVGWLERFRRELRLTRELAHPHIIPAYHLETFEGVYFYTMKYIKGFTLKHLIVRYQRLPAELTLALMASIGDALARAHSLGVIHRDLKSANIMLEPIGPDLLQSDDLRPYLMDFGIAADLSAQQITAAGQLLGTPQYMSPEQATGGDIRPTADLYSFAVVLYEALTGTTPFKGETAVAIYNAQMARAYPPLLDQHPGLAALIDACLQPNPDDRPQSMRIVLHAIGELRAQLKQAPKPAVPSLKPPTSSAPSPDLHRAPPDAPTPPVPSATPAPEVTPCD